MPGSEKPIFFNLTLRYVKQGKKKAAFYQNSRQLTILSRLIASKKPVNRKLLYDDLGPYTPRVTTTSKRPTNDKRLFDAINELNRKFKRKHISLRAIKEGSKVHLSHVVRISNRFEE